MAYSFYPESLKKARPAHSSPQLVQQFSQSWRNRTSNHSSSKSSVCTSMRTKPWPMWWTTWCLNILLSSRTCCSTDRPLHSAHRYKAQASTAANSRNGALSRVASRRTSGLGLQTSRIKENTTTTRKANSTLVETRFTYQRSRRQNIEMPTFQV